jgi:hypothetical protein
MSLGKRNPSTNWIAVVVSPTDSINGMAKINISATARSQNPFIQSLAVYFPN